MKVLSDELDHGSIGRLGDGYGRLDGLPAARSPRWADIPAGDWCRLAEQMASDPEETLEDEPDHEENLFLPAGYTYLGQFVDHDLTFDTTSSVDLHSPPPRNQRTLRFDLDCLYGSSPADRPFMYGPDKASFVIGRTRRGQPDLPRSFDPDNGGYRRAIIGDPRNDENSIVCQIHLAMMRFHNAVVERLRHSASRAVRDLFDAARNEVRWTYQRIVVEDFLKRLVHADVWASFERQRMPKASTGKSTNLNAFKLFRRNRSAIPLEFAGAAYRFGHSMVRNGYRLNVDVAKHIFASDPDDSLMGFEPLSDEHVIDDWSRFFPSPRSGDVWFPGQKNRGNSQSGKHRLQYAYRIDTALVDPLSRLPPPIEASEFSLIDRNLQRTSRFKLPSGQQVARVIGARPMAPGYLVTRHAEGETDFKLVPIPKPFLSRTPLWFYVLAEAQASYLPSDILSAGRIDSETLRNDPRCTGSQLGPVGGRILLEVFNGLLDDDPDSYRNHPDAIRRRPQDWLIKDFRMWHLINREFR